MGKPNGLWTEYNEDGSLLRVMNYSHGKAEGKWKSFHKDRRDPIRGEFCKRQETGSLFMVGRKWTFKIQ